MSASDVVLTLLALVAVSALVVDHRCGWLTGLLVDNRHIAHGQRARTTARTSSAEEASERDDD